MSEDVSESKEEYMHKVCGLTEEEYKLAMNPQLVDFILADLEKRIKHDNPVKLSVFFTGLSGFLKEPINLFQKGESGIGKSYNTVQSLKYFPVETTVLLGGLSPKALIHDYGTLLTEDGKPAENIECPEKPRKSDFEDKEEYKDQIRFYKKGMKEYTQTMKKTYTLIELSRKTLVFLETPEFEAFRMLYPILSHDTERIEYRFVDKPSKGQMRTMHVVIQGWPATVFLTVDRRYMQELATRSFTVTPQNSKEKIEAANQLINMKSCYPWLNSESEETLKIKGVIIALQKWIQSGEVDVIIPFEGLYELFPSSIVRDMRDFQHFIQFLKTITILHLFQRPQITINGKVFVVSTMYDVAVAINVYSEIFETTRTGTEQAILDFYHSIVKQKNVWYLKGLTEEYNAQNTQKVSSNTLRDKLDRLAQIGYIDIERDEEDKRLNIYKPLQKNGESMFRIAPKTLSEGVFKSKLEKAFKKWKENVLGKTGLKTKIKKFFMSDQPELKFSDLEHDVLDQNIFSVSNLLSQEHLSKAETSLKQENSLETITKPQTERVPSIDSQLPLGVELKNHRDQNISLNNSQLTPQVVPSGSSLLETNGEATGYKQQNQIAYVCHVKTGEPCYNNCGLASEWRVRIDSQFGEPEVTQLFCTGCWNKAKKELEKCGFKIEFEEAKQP